MHPGPLDLKNLPPPSSLSLTIERVLEKSEVPTSDTETYLRGRNRLLSQRYFKVNLIHWDTYKLQASASTFFLEPAQ